MNLSRACPAFSVAFMVVYLASMYLHPNLTLFTYAPRADVWHMGIPDLGRGGPGMYWFSWLTTAFAAGLGAGVIALFVPQHLDKKLWSGWVWVVPILLTLFLLYIERTWFGIK